MKSALFSLFLLLSTTAMAGNDWSIRVAAGSASASDFDELYYFSGLNKSPLDTNFFGIEGGYRVAEDVFDWPIDIYTKGGFNYLDENGHQSNILEATLYIKFYAKFNIFNNQLRFGLAEGVSYAEKPLYVEKMEAEEEGDNTSNLLNYMEITFDIDLGRLTGNETLKNTYFGYLIKHRSGAHGTFGGVEDGGSNYNAIYIEKSF
jgi:outer membrane protein